METSEPEGTTITVTLPLGRKKERRFERPFEPLYQNNKLFAALEQIQEQKILLVDDDPFNLKILEKHLNHPKLILYFAENGKVAHEKHYESSYNVIFMDMEMPVMNGLDAVRTIREQERSEKRKSVPIIALSGHDDNTARQKCVEAGFTGYLMKPAKQEDLIREILKANGTGVDVEEYSPARPSPAKQAATFQGEMQDTDYLVRIDPDLEDLIPSFLKKKGADISELQIDLDNNNFEKVKLLGHKLKGGFSIYGFNVMSGICANIENFAKVKNRVEIEEYLNQLKVFIKNVRIEYTKSP
jgi:CheY-like chemotaxis protein/HPt (histidine-containing phosphotransfer) domain-containing protein